MDCSGEERTPAQPVSRVEFLKRAGAAGVAVSIPATMATESALAESEAVQLTQLAAVSPNEARTLGAFLERLIPTDATGPGAKEANVLRYIDRSLAGPLFAFRSAYTAALVSLDAYSERKFGRAFADLSAEQQDAILTDMDRNQATGFSPNAKAVFEMFRTHAVQGMFSDPAHGGNTNFVGWKLVRFPGPRLVISAKDQRLDVVPTASMKSAYSIPLFKSSKRS
jgi:gluconate 2-dehydrogenase gamma chain